MKECIVIISYCDTAEKVELINKTIDNIKQYELPIFIYAHYPLSDEVQKKVHSYHYSSDNPILKTRWNIFWYFTDKYKLEIKVYDFYFTVLKAWSESIRIMDNYDRIHMINYDTNLYPELFELSKKYHDKSFILENIPIDGHDKVANTKHMIAIYFCLNKEAFNFFRENITLEKYLLFPQHTPFLPLVEEFVPSFAIGKDFYYVPSTEYDNKRLHEYEIGQDTRFNWDKTLSLDNTKIFIGEFNEHIGILFFDVKEKLNVTLNVNNYITDFNVTETHLFNLNMGYKDLTSLVITVNGINVNNNLIKKLKHLESKIYPL